MMPPINVARQQPSSLSTKIILLFIAGTIIREALAPFTGHPFDFELWIRLGYYTAQGIDPYRISPPVPGLSMPGAAYMPSIGYPPVWPFILAALYKLYVATGVSSRFFYYFILKQPMILGDLLDGVLIYKIIAQRSPAGATKALAFWLLCPFTIIVSAVWGMFDQFVLVFVLLSIYWLSRTETSAITEAIGILLKAIPVIYLPLLAFVQKSRAKIIQYLATSIAISLFFVFLPYLVFPTWNITALIGTGSSVINTVGGSMNYFELISTLANYKLLPSWTYGFIYVISYLWVPALLYTSYYCVKILRNTGVNPKSLALSAVIVTLVFYLTRIQINEQYAIYFIGLGLIDCYLLGSSMQRKKEFYGVWLSALAFLIANNSFLVRFLDPISIYYVHLDGALDSGVPGGFRVALLIITSISFSIFCLLYLRSAVAELKSYRVVPQ
jgi:hypothetical protein